MRIEPDLMNRRDKRIKKSGSQIDESIGGNKSGSDRGFPLESVILAESVERQQWQHSPRTASSSLHPKFQIGFFFDSN